MEKLKSLLSEMTFLCRLRLFFGLFFVVLIGVFLYLKIVPAGTAVYERTWPRGLASGKGFIYDFKPAIRLGEEAADDSLKLIAEPVYFSLFTPRTFNEAIVTVKYADRLAASEPLIEIGVRRDKLTDSYGLKPLQNSIIDGLSPAWSGLADGQGTTVWQAEKDYPAATDFFRDLKTGRLRACAGEIAECVAVYNYSWPLAYQPEEGWKQSETIINQPLRGAHQFYVYFAGDWKLGLSFTALNLDSAPDPISVEVLLGDVVIASQSLSAGDEPKHISLAGTDPVGVYKVKVNIGDDTVISEIKSSSDKISFINRVWPVSGRGNLELFTDASNLQAQTLSPASLQKISFGSGEFDLDKAYEQLSFKAPTGAGAKRIGLAKDDVILSADGVFAFSREALFNPGVEKVGRYFTPGEKIKYIIAAYETPQTEGDLKIASARIDLRGAYRENGKYNFMISIPGLKSEDGSDDYLEIKEIRVELNGRSLFEKIKSFFYAG